LNSPGLVAEITGSLTAEAQQDYYDFQWQSGAFSVTASVPDAPSGASYSFSVGAAGTCGSEEGSATLNGADSFTGTIAVANLAAGQYCIGIDTTSTMDPAFALIFNTPVTSNSAPSSVPEPSGFVLLSIGLLVISWRLLARRSRSI
jgi:PEP-CTERM motif